DELAKWYGPDRRIFLPEGLLDRSEIPAYLTGEVPGDYGYDPFGLSKKPEDFAKYQAYELIHARWAMLGAAGFIIPEAFNKFGANCGPEAVAASNLGEEVAETPRQRLHTLFSFVYCHHYPFVPHILCT
ncbi:hypothetical protein EI008_26670, partial [Escherichia coli]|nr:hypothetical protein [Escherichia coli]